VRYSEHEKERERETNRVWERGLKGGECKGGEGGG